MFSMLEEMNLLLISADWILNPQTAVSQWFELLLAFAAYLSRKIN